MTIINLIVPLFLIILLGYLLKRIGFLPKRFGQEFNKVIYYIALPFLLFDTTSKLDTGAIFSVEVLFSYPMVLGLTVALCGFFSFLMVRKQRGAFIQGSYRGNLAYLGLPIVYGTLGEDAMGYASIIVGVGALANTLTSILVLQFLDEKANGKSVWHKLLNVAKSPIIIAIVLGFIISALGIRLPVLIDNAIELIAKISLPSILLIIGLTLELGKIREHLVFNAAAGIIKLFVMPALVFFVVPLVFSVDNTLLNVLVIMAAMPTATISYAFAREFNSDETLANSIVNFTTLASLGTIPAVLFLFLT